MHTYTHARTHARARAHTHTHSHTHTRTHGWVHRMYVKGREGWERGEKKRNKNKLKSLVVLSFVGGNLLNVSFQLMIQCDDVRAENSVTLEHNERNSASQKGPQKNEAAWKGCTQ